MNRKILKLHHISLRMPNQKSYFFHDISITFTPGVHCVTGKNGIGKSTLFRLIGDSITHGEVVSGSIDLDGITYSYDSNGRLPETYRQHIQYIVQKTDVMLVPEFSCEKNLRFALLPGRPLFAPLPEHRVLPEFFSALDIDLKKPVKQLSGGQRQIVSILMILQKESRVLLLDEPTAALDEENAHMVMQFVTKLAQEQELVVLVITHDNDIIRHYAQDRCLVISLDSEGNRMVRHV